MYPEGLISRNRISRGQQSPAHEVNPPNRVDSGSGQLLPPHTGQPPDGLADWFVAKHTTDEALFRGVLSRQGFRAPSREFPRLSVRVYIDPTEVGRLRVGK